MAYPELCSPRQLGCHTALPTRLPRTTLRTLEAGDASSLAWVLDQEVQRYLPHAPTTVEDLARYTAWVARQVGLARQLSLAIVMDGQPIGIIQGRVLEATGRTIEWGFALARPFWGRGLLQESGRAFLTLAVEHLGIQHIEARTALANHRAAAALRRLGARCEGVIPCGLADRATDCFLWSSLASDVDGEQSCPDHYEFDRRSKLWILDNSVNNLPTSDRLKNP